MVLSNSWLYCGYCDPVSTWWKRSNQVSHGCQAVVIISSVRVTHWSIQTLTSTPPPLFLSPPPNLQASPGIWTFTDKNASDTIAFCGIFCHFSVEDSLKHNKMYHFQIEYSSRQLKAKQKYWLGKKHSTSFINKNEHTSEWWGFERHCTHW